MFSRNKSFDKIFINKDFIEISPLRKKPVAKKPHLPPVTKPPNFPPVAKKPSLPPVKTPIILPVAKPKSSTPPVVIEVDFDILNIQSEPDELVEFL
jgi:hypothetical protein